MTQLPLRVYKIDMKYIRNLHKIDNRIFSVSPQIGKDERPFLGVIIICNKQRYCVPLSKPKPKHQRMRDKIDFKKIVHNGNLIGVLNFNLMIPVENAQIQQIDTKIRRHDNADTRKKKELYISGENFAAREQCLDFIRMELECSRYNEKLKEQRREKTI